MCGRDKLKDCYIRRFLVWSMLNLIVMGFMKLVVVILVLLVVYGIVGYVLDEKNEKGMFNFWKYKIIDNCLF